jgi:hypothetical protein
MPAPEKGAAQTAELRARDRPGNAVHGDPHATLEPPDGLRGQWPGDAVDGAVVEAAGHQRDLEAGNLWVGDRVRSRRQHDGCEYGKARDESPRAHGWADFSAPGANPR